MKIYIFWIFGYQTKKWILLKEMSTSENRANEMMEVLSRKGDPVYMDVVEIKNPPDAGVEPCSSCLADEKQSEYDKGFEAGKQIGYEEGLNDGQTH